MNAVMIGREMASVVKKCVDIERLILQEYRNGHIDGAHRDRAMTALRDKYIPGLRLYGDKLREYEFTGDVK